MKKLNKILIISFIGGVVLGGTIISDNLRINDLQQIIDRKDSAIHEYFLRNKEITNKNDELLKKNNQLEQNNKELQEKIKEFRLQVTFNEDNITEPSNVSAIKLNKLFTSNNTYNNLIGLENAFVDAEKQYNVNAIFLLSLISQESGFGSSRRAIYDNNMSGYEVYSDSADGKLFSSKYDSVMATAKLLHNEYIIGRNMKDIYSINKVYCPVNGYYWSNSIIKISNTYVNQINNLYSID